MKTSVLTLALRVVVAVGAAVFLVHVVIEVLRSLSALLSGLGAP